MSHVDEGQLHAYLDGALDALPAVEAAEVRVHLEVCHDCGERLDQARLMRDRAAEILGATAPVASAMPPWEELRRRAAVSGAPAQSPRIRHFHWAASVVLALGIGWVLRGQTVDLPADAFSGESSMEAVAPQVPEVVLDEAPVAVVGDAAEQAGPRSVAERFDSGDGPTGAAGPGAVVATGTVAAESELGGSATSLRREVDVGIGPTGSATTVAASPTVLPTVSDRVVDVAVTRPPAPTAAPIFLSAGARAPQADRPSRTGQDLAPPLPLVSGEGRAGRGQFSRPMRASDEGERRQIDSTMGSLVVPGLTVISVSWFEIAGADEAAVRVLQMAESGDTVEVVHLPFGVGPEALPDSDDGRARLEAEGPEGWRVLRSHIDPARLRVLLERLQGS